MSLSSSLRVVGVCHRPTPAGTGLDCTLADLEIATPGDSPGTRRMIPKGTARVTIISDKIAASKASNQIRMSRTRRPITIRNPVLLERKDILTEYISI